MKNTGKIAFILLMLIITSNGILNAQRGMRGMVDTTRAERYKRSMELRNQNKTQVMHRGMRQGPVNNMQGGDKFARGRQMNSRQMMPIERMGRGPSGQGRYGMGAIQGLTDEQKKSLFALSLDQEKEMNKLRDEMSTKMQVLRENHRKLILEQLTDEQKKAIELAHPSAKKAPVKSN